LYFAKQSKLPRHGPVDVEVSEDEKSTKPAKKVTGKSKGKGKKTATKRL
jgi:hypothetical protein